MVLPPRGMTLFTRNLAIIVVTSPTLRYVLQGVQLEVSLLGSCIDLSAIHVKMDNPPSVQDLVVVLAHLECSWMEESA